MTKIRKGTWEEVEATQPCGKGRKATPCSDRTLRLSNASETLSSPPHLSWSYVRSLSAQKQTHPYLRHLNSRKNSFSQTRTLLLHSIRRSCSLFVQALLVLSIILWLLENRPKKSYQTSEGWASSSTSLVHRFESPKRPPEKERKN